MNKYQIIMEKEMTPQKNALTRIPQLSRLLSLICIGLIFLLPAATFIIWLKIDWFTELFRHQYDVNSFDIKTKAFGLAFSMLPLSIWMFGLYNLRRLFENYASGRVFVPENAKYIKYFAWMSIFGGALSPLFGGVFSIILSMNHVEGERFLTIGLGTTELQTILLGLVFVVIAHVMEAAHKISEENNQFI